MILIIRWLILKFLLLLILNKFLIRQKFLNECFLLTKLSARIAYILIIVNVNIILIRYLIAILLNYTLILTTFVFLVWSKNGIYSKFSSQFSFIVNGKIVLSLANLQSTNSEISFTQIIITCKKIVVP